MAPRMYSFGCCCKLGCVQDHHTPLITDVLTRSLRIALLERILVEYNQRENRSDAHDKNHFLLQLPIIIVLWTHFPIEMKELFQRLVFGGENILDDGH